MKKGERSLWFAGCKPTGSSVSVIVSVRSCGHGLMCTRAFVHVFVLKPTHSSPVPEPPSWQPNWKPSKHTQAPGKGWSDLWIDRIPSAAPTGSTP